MYNPKIFKKAEMAFFWELWLMHYFLTSVGGCWMLQSYFMCRHAAALMYAHLVSLSQPTFTDLFIHLFLAGLLLGPLHVSICEEKQWCVAEQWMGS